MRLKPKRACVVAVLACVVATVAFGQTPAADRTQILLSSRGQSPVAMQSSTPGVIVREIDDPHTGARWLLMRDERHPGGPGRMVLAEVDESESGGEAVRAAGRSVNPAGGNTSLPPVIHEGDRLTVEEHTTVVDVALEARALGQAAAGSAFNARLTLGGRVVRVVALGSGRAALDLDRGGRR